MQLGPLVERLQDLVVVVEGGAVVTVYRNQRAVKRLRQRRGRGVPGAVTVGAL